MSEHRATLTWKRNTDAEFSYQTYTRDYDWTFENGHVMRGSATPDFMGNPDCVDPEAAFVASLAACHMLTLLAFACKKRFVVESYVDEASGTLEAGPDGKWAITADFARIQRLRPGYGYQGVKDPVAEKRCRRFLQYSAGIALRIARRAHS